MNLFTLSLALIFISCRGHADQISCDSSSVCKKMSECPSMKQLIPTGKAVTCASENGELRVCCPIVSSTPKEIVIQKCDEYTKVANLKQNCYTGKEAIVNWRIDPKQYPHMAAIGYNFHNDSFSHVKWLCSGSLISEQFILITAHCAKPRTQSGPKWALLGEIDLNVKNGATARVYGVAEVFIHPNYTDKLSYHDIALLKLNATVTFSPFIRPICLHTSPDIPSSQKVAKMVGWEIAPIDGNRRLLLDAEVSIMVNSICDIIYGNYSLFKNGVDPKSMICAGVSQNEKDLCAGSSGGPLQIPLLNTNCMWTEIGITAVGKDCGKQLPSIYTKVAYYIDWIQSIVWP